jgi:DNA invertase Pin-like site-specific DNA recombinase
MKINYVRISSGSQNNDVQVFNLPSEYKVFKETCSGSIAFQERSQGAKIIELVKEGKVEEILIHDISRIGRNNLDVLSMIQFFTLHNVNLVSRREGLSTMIEGKVNPIASLIIGILSTLSQHELDRMRERRNEGIARAKERGVYSSNGGNKREETREEFLAKDSTKKIVKFLKEKNSLRRVASLSGCSLGKVQKVVKILGGVPEPKAKTSTLRDNYIESLEELDSLDAIQVIDKSPSQWLKENRVITPKINVNLENETEEERKEWERMIREQNKNT